ncbi:protein kinase [Aureococcus anophagefferens]|nr:protein kinase [Aureococcus anophagefferens]
MATQAGGGIKGTPAYMAPELLESNTFTEKTDVYAFALVIWEVLTGDVPWAGLNQIQIAMQILAKAARPQVPAGPADLVDLMTRCWAQDAERPAFAEVKAALAL